MEQDDSTNELAQLIPFLSSIDKQKGAKAVIDVLRYLDIIKFDYTRDRLIFRQTELSANVFNSELDRRLREN